MMDFWAFMGWSTAAYVAIGAGIYLPRIPDIWRAASEDLERDGVDHCHACFFVVMCMHIVSWPQIFVEEDDDD